MNNLGKYGDPIWERLFMISMNYKDSLSPEQIRMFGMPTVGVSSIDNEMANGRIDKYVTINQMVEYYKVGIPIYVRNHSETKDIYDIISNYLNCWKTTLQNGINIGGAPIEDLVALDRFASTVYDHAVEHMTEEFFESTIFKHIGSRKAGRAAFEKKPEVLPVDTDIKKHESMATLFSERVFMAKGRQWK